MAKNIKYAYSIKTSRVTEKDFPYPSQPLSCTSEVVAFAASLQNADIEKMITLYLDAQNKLICIQVMQGTVNACVVFPREIFRHALLAGASGILLIHNHPSGSLRPSDQDIRLTREIRDIGKKLDINVHDHIIMGTQSRFYSFREEGIL
jgi:DNA repair protein RadC